MKGRKECVCLRARHQHGTRGAYTKDGCRCFPCRIAASRITATGQYADDGIFVDRTPTILRLQALHVLGWSERAIADRLGVTKQAVRDIRVRAGHPILAVTAQRITGVYEEVWDQPPPGQFVTRTKNWAAERGWQPPMEIDDALNNTTTPFINSERDLHNLIPDHGTAEIIDEIAVERAIHGDRVPLTRAEMTYAIDTLTRMGHSAEEAATRLGVSSRLVQRYRAKGRAA